MRWLWLTVVVSVVHAQRQSEAYLSDESDLPKASKVSGEANKVKAQEAVSDGGSSPTAPHESSYEPDAPPRYTRPDSAPAIKGHTKEPHDSDGPPKYVRPDNAPGAKGRKKHWKRPSSLKGPRKHIRPKGTSGTKGRKEDPLAEYGREPVSAKEPTEEKPKSVFDRPSRPEGPPKDISTTTDSTNALPDVSTDVVYVKYPPPSPPRAQTAVESYNLPPPPEPESEPSVTAPAYPTEGESSESSKAVEEVKKEDQLEQKGSKGVEEVKKEDQLEHKGDIGEGPNSPAEGNAPSYPTDNGEIHSPSSSNADRVTSNVTTTAQPAGYQNPQGKTFEAAAAPAVAATIAPLLHNSEQPKTTETVEKSKSKEEGKDAYVESAPIEMTFGGVEGSGSLEEVGGEGSGESVAKLTADKKVEGTTQESTTLTGVEEEKVAEDRYEVGPHGEGSGEMYSHHVLDSRETSGTPKEQPGAESKAESKVGGEPLKEVEFKEKEGEATVPQHEVKQKEIGEKGVEAEMEKSKEASVQGDEKSGKESPKTGFETSSTPKANVENEKESKELVNLEAPQDQGFDEKGVEAEMEKAKEAGVLENEKSGKESLKTGVETSSIPKTNAESEKESAKPMNLENSPQEEGSNKDEAESSTADERTAMGEENPYGTPTEDVENGTAAALPEEEQTVPEKGEEIVKFNYAVNKAQVVEGGTNMSEEDFSEGTVPEEATAEKTEASKSEENDKKKQHSNGPLVKIDSTSKDHDIVIAYTPKQPKKRPHGTGRHRKPSSYAKPPLALRARDVKAVTGEPRTSDEISAFLEKMSPSEVSSQRVELDRKELDAKLQSALSLKSLESHKRNALSGPEVLKVISSNRFDRTKPLHGGRLLENSTANRASTNTAAPEDSRPEHNKSIYTDFPRPLKVQEIPVKPFPKPKKLPVKHTTPPLPEEVEDSEVSEDFQESKDLPAENEEADLPNLELTTSGTTPHPKRLPSKLLPPPFPAPKVLKIAEFERVFPKPRRLALKNGTSNFPKPMKLSYKKHLLSLESNESTGLPRPVENSPSDLPTPVSLPDIKASEDALESTQEDTEGITSETTTITEESPERKKVTVTVHRSKKPKRKYNASKIPRPESTKKWSTSTSGEPPVSGESLEMKRKYNASEIPRPGNFSAKTWTTSTSERPLSGDSLELKRKYNASEIPRPGNFSAKTRSTSTTNKGSGVPRPELLHAEKFPSDLSTPVSLPDIKASEDDIESNEEDADRLTSETTTITEESPERKKVTVKTHRSKKLKRKYNASEVPRPGNFSEKIWSISTSEERPLTGDSLELKRKYNASEIPRPEDISAENWSNSTSEERLVSGDSSKNVTVSLSSDNEDEYDDETSAGTSSDAGNGTFVRPSPIFVNSPFPQPLPVNVVITRRKVRRHKKKIHRKRGKSHPEKKQVAPVGKKEIFRGPKIRMIPKQVTQKPATVVDPVEVSTTAESIIDPTFVEESIDEAAVEKSDVDDDETSTAPWQYPTAPGERTAPPAVLAAHAAQDATFVDRSFVAKQLIPKEDEEESLDETEPEQNTVLESMEETTTDHYVTAPEKFQPHDKPVAEYTPDLTHSEAEEDAESSKASVGEDFADLPVAPNSALEQTSKELVKKMIEEVVKTTASSSSEAKTTTTRQPWTPYEMDCETEVDDKGDLCKDWARGGLCTMHRPTMFLFCRKTCLCTGPSRFARS